MLVFGLAELGEYPKTGFRMQKGHQLVAGSVERNLMNETRSAILGLAELTVNVVGGKRYVVNSRTVLF